jgi:hypothetical protein
VRPFVFIPTGVTVGEDVFIGSSVCFTNDKYPKVSRELSATLPSTIR